MSAPKTRGMGRRIKSAIVVALNRPGVMRAIDVEAALYSLARAVARHLEESSRIPAASIVNLSNALKEAERVLSEEEPRD